MGCLLVDISRLGGVSVDADRIGGISCDISRAASADARLSRVGGMEADMAREGKMKCRFAIVCSTGIMAPYLEISPEILWIWTDPAYNDVYSNTTWGIN